MLIWPMAKLFSVHFFAAVSLKTFLSAFESLIGDIEFVVRKQSLRRRSFLFTEISLKFSINDSKSQHVESTTYQQNCFASQVPQVPHIFFVLVERNRMQFSLNFSLS